MGNRCPCLPVAGWHSTLQARWTWAQEEATALDGHFATWSEKTWGTVTEAAGCYFGWLKLIEQPFGSDTEGVCPRQLLARYINFTSDRLNPTTVHIRVRDLERALSVLEPSFDRQHFTDALRHLRGRVRGTKSDPTLPSTEELRELGCKLMAMAFAETDERPRVNAIRFRDGLAIAGLTYRSLRRLNFASLQIGFDLREFGAGNWMIVLSSDSVKNREPECVPWPRSLVKPLDDYLRRFRPLLSNGRFPEMAGPLWLTYRHLGPKHRHRSMTPRTFYLALARRTKAEFGYPVGPHDFRHTTARSATTLEDAALLLGNTRPVAERHYRRSDPNAAFAAHLELLAWYRDT